VNRKLLIVAAAALAAAVLIVIIIVSAGRLRSSAPAKRGVDSPAGIVAAAQDAEAKGNIQEARSR